MKISERLFGSPISGEVRDELSRRQGVGYTPRVREGGETIYESIDLNQSISEGGYNLNSKTPFVRMWTSVKIYRPALDDEILAEFRGSSKNLDARSLALAFQKTDASAKGSKLKPVYGDTGKLEKYVVYRENARDYQPYGTQTYIVGDFNYQEAYGEISPGESKYNATTVDENKKTIVEKELPPLLKDNPLIKPQAGITSITSATKEFLGLTKETTVNFVVNNFEDFDKIYNKYFLKPGAQIFVDFGFTDIDYLYEPKELINSSDIQEFLYGTNKVPGEDTPTAKNVHIFSKLGEIARNEGSLEVIQGTVIDYNAKILKEGGVDCSVTLLSTNSALMSSKVHKNKLYEIKNKLKEQARFLGVASTLNKTKESSFKFDKSTTELQLSDFELFLLSPDANSSPKNKIEYDKQILSLAVKRLANSDARFTPRYNSIRTGVFVNGTNAEDVYISWGFFEDIIINENFGFGKNKNDINEGKSLNIRMDSSNSFTFWFRTLEDRQKIAGEDPENNSAPNYLFPETWGNGEGPNKNNSENKELDYLDNINTDGTKTGGSYSYQKGRYPSSQYKENDKTAQVDKELFRIPIREIFINTQIIIDACTEVASSQGDVKDFIKIILDKLNAESEGTFEWKMTSDLLGTEIKIVDTLKLKTLDDINTSGIDGNLISGENAAFKNLFTFNIMSPNSIVKDYNLEFKLPQGDIGTMYAIQGMGSEDTLPHGNQDIDNAVAISSLDREALRIQYMPERGGHRAVEIANSQTTGDSTADDLEYYESWENLLRSNVYQINTYKPASSIGKVLQTVQESSEINDKISGGAYESDKQKNERILQEFKNKSTRRLQDLGYRIVNSLTDYNKVSYISSRENTIVKRPNLLPFTLSLTINGISTIHPGDVFRVDYLPEMYQKNVFCQITNVTHNVNSEGWFTEIETAFRPLPDIKQVYYTYTEERQLAYFHPNYIPNVYFKKSVGKVGGGGWVPNRLYIAGFNYARNGIWNPDLHIQNQLRIDTMAGMPARYEIEDRLAQYDEVDRNKEFNERLRRGTEDSISLSDLSPFMTEVEPYPRDKDHSTLGLNYIQRIFRFKITEDIENVEYGYPWQGRYKSQQGFGFYNPAYHIRRSIIDTNIYDRDEGIIFNNYKRYHTIVRESDLKNRKDVLLTSPIHIKNLRLMTDDANALAAREREGAVDYYIRDYYIPAPIILKPFDATVNNYYYLVIHENNHIYITDTNGVKKENMRVFDQPFPSDEMPNNKGAHKYPHLNIKHYPVVDGST